MSDRFSGDEEVLTRLVREAGDPSVLPDPQYAETLRATILDRLAPTEKNGVLEAAVAFTARPRSRFQFIRRYSWRILASTVAMVVAASLFALLMFPAPSIGWAEVAAAVNSQKWIQVTFAWPDGKTATSWLSPQLQISAFHGDRHAWFLDGRQGVKYAYHQYSGQGEKIAKLLLRESEAEQTLPVDFMAGGSWTFLDENVVSRDRREVLEGSKRWIEFEVVFSRGKEKTGTLRVDPETRLPVYLKTKSCTFTFQYPADGPADIYALGVPANVGIVDLVPSEECQKVIRAMAASRAKIGNFRLGVINGPQGWIVWRKGDRWRIDFICQGTYGPAMRGAKPPDGLGWNDPFAEKLGMSWIGPAYVCDGRAVYKNANSVLSPLPADWKLAPGWVTPRSLLCGEGLGSIGGYASKVNFASLVYPDLTPFYGWGFEFDPKPADAPGCVLIKRSAEIAMKGRTGNEWYYIDPAKGCAVVRVELFNLPAGAKADPKSDSTRQTIRMEDFQLSPQGYWYPAVIRGPFPQSEVHYHFDFDVALPDSLFVIEDTGKPKE
jgi:hypothetical protein